MGKQHTLSLITPRSRALMSREAFVATLLGFHTLS